MGRNYANVSFIYGQSLTFDSVLKMILTNRKFVIEDSDYIKKKIKKFLKDEYYNYDFDKIIENFIDNDGCYNYEQQIQKIIFEDNYCDEICELSNDLRDSFSIFIEGYNLNLVFQRDHNSEPYAVIGKIIANDSDEFIPIPTKEEIIDIDMNLSFFIDIGKKKKIYQMHGDCKCCS